MARGTVLFALLAAGLAAAVYVNALNNPFVFDDRSEILENPSIRSLANPLVVLRHSLTRPVTNLSYAIDFASWGEDPFGYHLTNLVLHVANVLLLFAWLRRVTLDRTPSLPPVHGMLAAFAGAALFAVHPLMTEAVGYVSGRAEVLCATWFLAGAYCLYRSFALRGRAAVGLQVAGVAFFLLALGTKELGVMLPAVVLACDLLLVRRAGTDWRARFWRIHAPLMLVVLALGLARVWFYVAVEHPTAAGLDWRHVLVNLHVVQRYLALLVVPVSQSIVPAVYPFESLFDSRLLAAIAVVGGVLAWAIHARNHEPLITFGIVWFFLALLPSAALILLADRGQPMAEHRVYLASCGFFMVCAAGVSRVLRAERDHARRRFTMVAAGLSMVLLILGALTIARNRVWSDPVLLWQDAAREAPRTWAAHYGLADALHEADECESAEASYRRAIALRPDHANGYLGAADCLANLERPAAARELLRQAIARVPADVRPRLALATLEERVFGRPEEALRLCREALSMAPNHPEAQRCIVRNSR
ncbi:tetratricopeptide repeat protein [soil metagenome]